MFDPQHLEALELEYELNLRGVYNLAVTARRKAQRVQESLDRERAQNISYNESPWAIDADVRAARESLQQIEAMIANNRQDPVTLELAHNRLLHLEARVFRMSTDYPDWVASVIDLRADVNFRLDQIRPLLVAQRNIPTSFGQVTLPISEPTPSVLRATGAVPKNSNNSGPSGTISMASPRVPVTYVTPAPTI